MADRKPRIMDGWTDGWMDGRTDGWMDGWMDGLMDGWMEGWTDGWADKLLGKVLEESPGCRCGTDVQKSGNRFSGELPRSSTQLIL